MMKRSVSDSVAAGGANSVRKKRSSLSVKVDSVTESVSRKPAESVYCPHCDSSLSSKTYRRHKSLYFDEGTWTIIGHEDNTLSSASCQGIWHLVCMWLYHIRCGCGWYCR